MCRDAPCGPRCAEKNIHNSNLAVARTSEMSEIRPTCPKFAPRARNSRRGAEIRVAKTPSDDEPSHFFFFSLPLEIPSFFGTLIEILYIYYIFYFLTPPRYFGQRNTRLGYFSDISDVLATAKFELGIFLVYECRKSSIFCLRV